MAGVRAFAGCESASRRSHMLAGGASEEQILADFPYLEPDDIRASLEYAAAQIDHAVVMVSW